MEAKDFANSIPNTSAFGGSASIWLLILLWLMGEQSYSTDWIKQSVSSTRGRHFDEKTAEEQINRLHYIDANMEERSGAHWSQERIAELTKNFTFESDDTDWDKYVAFNFMYAKLCGSLNYIQILNATYKLFFAFDRKQTIADFLA